MSGNDIHAGDYLNRPAVPGADVGSVLHLLSALDAESIPYVSWKNNHQINDALAGGSDLDIFIPVAHRSAFLRYAGRMGWIRTENPVARYPWVTHIYSLDAELNSYHVHVYFKIVTGESWLKEYILPFDEFMIGERVRSRDSRVWILSDRAQAYLFAVRHLLKSASISSRLLYSRELESYRQEWRDCMQDVESLADYGPVRLNDYIAGSGLRSEGFRQPALRTSVIFRLSMLPFLRLPWWSLSARRATNFALRAANKLFLKRKKILPDGGLIIAISGVDGSGKSSMLAEADRILSGFLTVRRYALGRPQGRVMETLRKLVRGRRTQTSAPKREGTEIGANRRATVASAVSAAVLGLLRLRMARKALRSSLQGHLALVDRWPTDVVGMMDGPRIGLDGNGSMLVQFCARIEHWAYQCMPRADVCIFLEVPVQQLIDRNRRRIKPNKETDAEIVYRYESNLDYRPLARRVVRFDNDGDFDQKRNELIALIWSELIRS